MATYTTPRGVSYEELNGFPTFSGTREQLTISTEWKIAGTDILNLISECFPNPVVGGFAAYLPPLTYPGWGFVYCTNLNIRPLGGDDAPAQFDPRGFYNRYDHHIASLTFSTVNWEQQDGGDNGEDTTLRTIEISIGGEYMRLPGYAMFWEDRPTTPIADAEIEIGKLIPTIEYSIQVHDYAYLPFETIIDLLGKVNSSTGQVIGHETAETLLFLGASASRTITWRGAGTYQITYRFSERRVKWDGATYGWNHFWRPKDTTGWVRVKDKSGRLIFPKDNLSSLFTATS